MWTPAEAEVILREQWSDAESVGGFAHEYHAYMELTRLRETIEVPDGFRLIGHTQWSDYEEGGEQFLFIREEDETLWSFAKGSSVYGEYGEKWDPEPENIVDWLESVESNLKHAETFQGI